MQLYETTQATFGWGARYAKLRSNKDLIITQSLAWLLNVLRTGVREVSRSIAADISRTVHRSQIVVITAPGGTWWKRNEILKNPLDPISTY